MKIEFSRRIFQRFSDIKNHGNLFSGSRDVPCGRTDGQTDMTKPVDSFRNFANAPEMCICTASAVYSDRTLFLYAGPTRQRCKTFWMRSKRRTGVTLGAHFLLLCKHQILST
jgi:hypothetical protein